MGRTFRQIQEDIQALDVRERLLIVQQLIADLDMPPDMNVEAAWSDEIRRRLDAVRSGNSQTVSADDAIAEIRARLKG